MAEDNRSRELANGRRFFARPCPGICASSELIAQAKGKREEEKPGDDGTEAVITVTHLQLVTVERA